MMEIEVTIALIAGAVTIFTALLYTGVHIFFKTKSFEEEYGDKVKNIKFHLKSKLDQFVLDMVLKKLKKIDGIVKNDKGFEKWKKVNKPVFKNYLNEIGIEIVDLRELDELIMTAITLDEWSEFIIDMKKILRNIGLLIIGLGIFFLIAFGVYYIFGESIVPYAILFGFIISLILYNKCSEFNKEIKKIDSIYKKLETGFDI